MPENYGIAFEAGGLWCSTCGGSEVKVVDYDFGQDADSGYEDRGEWLICRECGAKEVLS